MFDRSGRQRQILMPVFAVSFLLAVLGWPLPLGAGPIHVAARDGDLATVIRLLEAKPDLTTTRCDLGKTPLHWATGWGQHQVMLCLLDRFGVNVNIRNKDGGTPLHVAASQARPKGARILIQHGANLDAKRHNGATALHVVALKAGRPGHHEVARILIEAGADCQVRMNNGITPLKLALHRGNDRTAELIRRHQRGYSHGSAPTPYRQKSAGSTLRSKQGPPSSSASDFLQRRRQMILQRFDRNDDGMLDQEERQAIMDFRSHRFGRGR